MLGNGAKTAKALTASTAAAAGPAALLTAAWRTATALAPAIAAAAWASAWFFLSLPAGVSIPRVSKGVSFAQRGAAVASAPKGKTSRDCTDARAVRLYGLRIKKIFFEK